MAASRKKIAEFLGNTPKTAENWEKEGRHVIKFIRKYMDDNDMIDEFMISGKIEKFEEKEEKNEEMEEFYVNNFWHKLLLRSTIRRNNIIKEMTDPDTITPTIPGKSFYEILNKSKATNKKELIKEIESNQKIRQKWKTIIICFLEEECSRVETEKMLNKKEIITKRLTNEKKRISWI